MKPTKTTTPPIKNSISRSPLRRGFLLISLALACFALSPTARAQDGAVGNGTNTAEGTGALARLTTASGNTANGYEALASNTTGTDNTANGVGALINNTRGSDNTANGASALVFNTTGTNNTANGYQALLSNTTGFSNTANGVGALNKNTTGGFNTANGVDALVNNTTGHNNIALGYLAGANLTTGNSNIHIGNQGVAAEGNTIRIGTAGKQAATFIAGIYTATAAGGTAVFVNSDGQLARPPLRGASSRRSSRWTKPAKRFSRSNR
jgi:hypothetical protein